MVENLRHPEQEAEIAMVGKYTQLHDAYLSVVEALKHGGIASRVNVHIRWEDSEEITNENVEEKLSGVDGILVPGGFGPRGTEGMITAIRYAREKKIPFLGICLGMQLLFDKSYEYGEHQGLGLIPGVMADLKEDIPANLKVPHMGWNSLHLTEKGKKHPLFKYSKEGDYVYFVHSFYGKDCDESLLATSEYGIPVTASAANENIMGCQFHPEKSGEVGLRILKAFSEL